MQIRFILVQNRQGKTRLSKWYVPYEDNEKVKLKGEVHRLVAPRDQKHQSNFVEVGSVLITCLQSVEILIIFENRTRRKLVHVEKYLS